MKRVNAIETTLVTISTEGEISIWDLEELFNLKEPVELVENFMSVYDFKMETRLVLLSICKLEEEKEQLIKEKP